MTNFWNRIQKSLSRSYKSVVALMLTMGMIFPLAMLGGSTMAAGTPVFNNMANDYPTLMIANRTQDADNYGSTTGANVGDTVAMRVYIHNSVVDSTANNVTVTASMDSNYSSSHNISATVSADNASPVSGNVTATSGDNVQLKYVPGTTQRFWFDADGAMQSEVLSDGILNGGVNIGNVQGCWEYVQYVVFQAEVVGEEIQAPELSINKEVMNVTDGTSYADSVDAEDNDTVRFRITVGNENGSEAENVILTDSLPSELDYLSGTTTVDGSSHADGVVANGITLGDLSVGEDVEVIFEARVDTTNDVRVENVATTIANNADPKSDNAFVNIEQEIVLGADLTIDKTVSFGRTSTNWEESVDTQEGDYVRFRVLVGNDGDETAINTYVIDDIDSRLEYIENSTYVDGDRESDDIFDEGIDLGDVRVGDEIEIIYTARSNTDRDITMENEATADADNADPVSDIARVLNSGDVVEEPYLDISKDVDENRVSPGQEVEYTIVLRNTGDADATDVTIVDDLPSDVRYISGSIDIDLDGRGDVEDDDLFDDGVVIDYMEPGDEVTIRYEARVDSDVDDGDRLENVVVATDDEGDRAEADEELIVENEGYLDLTKSVDKSRADAGDELEYTIVVENTGDSDVTNLEITDELPNYVEYINNSMDVDGDNVRSYDDEDLFESRGIRVSRLREGDEIVITFSVRIDRDLNRDITLENLAEVQADNGLRDEDIATTFVGMGGDNPSVNVTKLVKNLTLNESSFRSSNSANPGNELEYKITISNDGNETLTNVKLSDMLPSEINYLGGTARVWFNSSETSGDYNGLVEGNGISLPDMEPGDTITVTFRAKSKTSISDNESKTNTASVFSNQANGSDTATTVFDTVDPDPIPKPLPKTGTGATVGFVMFGALGTVVWYFREKYLLGLMF